jgi:hypothetical protein
MAFLIDDILTSPARGLMFIFKSVHEAVEADAVDERESLKAELNDLYMLLELGEITDDEFDEREEEILDRLDELDEMEGIE